MAAEDLTPSYYMVEDDDSIDTDIAERIAHFNGYPDGAGAVMALFPVDWTGAEGELVTLRENGTVALDLDGTFELPEPFDRGTPRTMITTTTGMAVLKPNHPDNQTIESGFRAVGVPVPDVVRAMNAREAARTGDRAALRAFVSEGLGRWSGWSEPVSTALLGNWADSLYNEGQLSPGAVDQFLAEARVINGQLKPIWLRQANRERVRLLDAPLGDGMTLYDVLSGQPGADTSFEGFDDPRLIEILDALSEEDQAVTIARSRPGVNSWPEAARVAGVPQPEVVGEQVRRKVKRLANQLTGRSRETGDGTGDGR
ncbi:hypothetical protein ACIQU3_16990 [Streptomyces sp. NPDC101110]|uniref:hypothetical protein n=1 Tax=Streptomyces sp. NPDC101110 TaxID=3366104 RepID=UPI00380036C8